MTPPTAVTTRNRWLRATGYGLLAEVCTIVTIIIVVSIYRYGVARGLSADTYAAFGQKAGGVIGIIGGTFFTYVFARLAMRGLSTSFVAHGLVVAIAAIALSVGGSVAGHQGVPAGYILASLLKLIAGGLAGYQSQRGAYDQSVIVRETGLSR